MDTFMMENGKIMSNIMAKANNHGQIEINMLATLKMVYEKEKGLSLGLMEILILDILKIISSMDMVQ